MQRVYSHPNPMLVGQVRSYLESHGIVTETKNDLLQGGAGELAPIDLWQEVWIVNENDAARVEKLLKKLNENVGEEWHCRYCEEINASTFELCWQCGKDNYSNYNY